MDLLEAADDSLADAMTVMAEWQETARVVEESGALMVAGKRRFPMMYANAVFPIDESADPDRVLSRADEFFSDRRYVLWARGEGSDPIGARATAKGFASLGVVPAMAIEEKVRDPERPVRVDRVTSAERFGDFVRVAQLAYVEVGLPEEIAASLFARSDAALASSVMALAFVDEEPAACALSITNALTGVGGVYWVGATPNARRRGAGDAVTRFVTNAAFDQGASVVVLQATNAGRPVYERMGYREMGQYARFLSPKRI